MNCLLIFIIPVTRHTRVLFSLETWDRIYRILCWNSC